MGVTCAYLLVIATRINGIFCSLATFASFPQPSSVLERVCSVVRIAYFLDTHHPPRHPPTKVKAKY